GAVYPILHRLLREGAVTMDVVEQEGRPAKKVYAITRSGRDDFATWLRKPAAADQVRREFLVKVLFARDLDPEELTAHLRDRQAGKVDAMTGAGRDDFAAWRRKPSAADQVRPEFLVKVPFARELAPEELTAHLRDRQAEVEGQIAVLEAVWSDPEAQANGYHA